MQGITIQLDWPCKTLRESSQNKGHWKSKAKAIANYREAAYWKGRGVVDLLGVRFDSAKISYKFFVPDNGRRDEANMIQMVKAGIDGLVDSGLLPGDHWQVLSTDKVLVEIDRDNPRVEIDIA